MHGYDRRDGYENRERLFEGLLREYEAEGSRN
jgi:hypothetical protein